MAASDVNLAIEVLNNQCSLSVVGGIVSDMSGGHPVLPSEVSFPLYPHLFAVGRNEIALLKSLCATDDVDEEARQASLKDVLKGDWSGKDQPDGRIEGVAAVLTDGIQQVWLAVANVWEVILFHSSYTSKVEKDDMKNPKSVRVPDSEGNACTFQVTKGVTSWEQIFRLMFENFSEGLFNIQQRKTTGGKETVGLSLVCTSLFITIDLVPLVDRSTTDLFLKWFHFRLSFGVKHLTEAIKHKTEETLALQRRLDHTERELETYRVSSLTGIGKRPRESTSPLPRSVPARDHHGTPPSSLVNPQQRPKGKQSGLGMRLK